MIQTPQRQRYDALVEALANLKAGSAGAFPAKSEIEATAAGIGKTLDQLRSDVFALAANRGVTAESIRPGGYIVRDGSKVCA
jgi:hypothetical protein